LGGAAGGCAEDGADAARRRRWRRQRGGDGEGGPVRARGALVRRAEPAAATDHAPGGADAGDQ